MFGEKKEHESYGMIGISNVTCSGGVNLFGSSIKHDRWITLRIKTADFERDLHSEWYHGNDSIIEVALSASQFAEFITTPNCGDGIPCTIKQVMGKQMKEPPYVGHNEIFNKELKEDFIKAMEDSDILVKESQEILLRKGSIKVADKQKLLNKITMLVQHIKANMPFLHEQFTRSMNKTVSVAKAEVESFYTNTIMKLGKKALEDGNKINIPKIDNSDNSKQFYQKNDKEPIIVAEDIDIDYSKAIEKETPDEESVEED